VVCCDDRGLAIFATLRQRRNKASAFLYAFDLLELDGADLHSGEETVVAFKSGGLN
jgi:ATP-dependent DNA ligase